MKLQKWIAPLVLAIVAAGAPVGRSQEARRLEIGMSRFSFSPSEITLKKGEPVILILTSHDVTHGIAVNELGIRKDVAAGQTGELDFTPVRTGTFEAKCSYFCGIGHTSMMLKINVVE